MVSAPPLLATAREGVTQVNKDEKSAVIDRLKTSLAGVPAVVVADFKGLTVQQTDELRSRFRKAEVSYEVVKNTLMRRAVAGTSQEAIEPLLKGNTAIAYHAEDPSAPAKVLRDFKKDFADAKLTVKGAYLDGKVLDEEGVKALASLPGKDELRSKLLSVFQGAPTQFVRTLIAGPQTFVQLLSARATQLES